MNELLKAKTDLQKQLEAAQTSLTAQTESTALLQQRAAELEREKAANEQMVRGFKDETAKLKADAERESRRADRMQEEMMSVKKTSDSKDQVIVTRNKKIDEYEQLLVTWDMKVKEEAHKAETFQSAAKELRARNMDLEAKVGSLTRSSETLVSDKESLEAEVLRKNDMVRDRTDACKQLQKANDTLTKQMEVLSASKGELEKHRDALKKELLDVQKELEAQSRLADGDEKMIKELHMQIKRLNSVLLSSKEATSQHKSNMDESEKRIGDLEIMIVGHKGEESRLRKLNYELEKQREKAVLTATNWHVKFQETTESVKAKEAEVDELKKKIDEERARLATQQALYEQVRAERNLFGKQHIESQDEIAEMKRKHKIMTHQIEQLQEEIGQKNEDLLSEHMMVKKLKLELKRMKKSLSDKEVILKNADTLLSSQDAEVKNLRNTLQEAEEAQVQQKKVYDDVVNERDVLGSQLIRRNDELALLYEKIRIQQSTLSKGEIQYRERLDDLRLLKRKIDDLKRQLQIRGNEVANVETLKHEVYHLQRELLQERIKVKALSEELENPMNVHRWRKLEGSDPKAYEMLQKIQTLQKRLIQKTEEVVEKDLLIQEKSKLYDELKAILARQPGPEIVEELTRLQLLLKEKQRQMKAMASELNMFQAQVMEYKYEIERLSRELQDLKRKYYEQKRREQLAREAQRGDLVDTDPLVKQQQQFHAAQPRFVGGGFALSATQ